MKNSTIIRLAFHFIIYALVQVLIMKDWVLYHYAYSFFYVGFIINTPQSLRRVYDLILSFLMGLLIDGFYNTPGIHAGACVLISFLKPYWVRVTYRGVKDIETIQFLSLKEMGFVWYATYTMMMILVHHLFVFFVEASNYHLFFAILPKVIMSTLFTFTLLLLTHTLFYKNEQYQ